jgi:hypothetical protein
MLTKTSGGKEEDTGVGGYLRHVLGVSPLIGVWKATGKLPHYLQDAYTLREMQLLGQRFVLASPRGKAASAALRVRKQLLQLQKVTGLPVVLVVAALLSYERKRLIDQKVPFIVPGNQMYLPMLGLDLREYFRQTAVPDAEPFSPATQALLITALLRTPWQAEWQPGPLLEALGYGVMTTSRAIRELAAAEIATVRQKGRRRMLHMEDKPAGIWQRAQPRMSTPVKRRVWVRLPVNIEKGLPLAGLSALAHYSMLAEPTTTVYAVSAAQWKGAAAADIDVLPEPEHDSCQWQVWSYGPGLLSKNKTVDPLSLWLSLQGSVDERVQMAMDELQRHFPW